MKRWWVGMLLAVCAAATAEGASIPLPPDVQEAAVEGPIDLVLGAQPTKMQMFATQMSLSGVRAFYDQALGRHGWQIATLPWFTQTEQAAQRFEQMAQEDPATLRDPETWKKVQAARQQLREFKENIVNQAIYATRGTDRLLLRFTPEERVTVVAVHQWEALAGEPEVFLGDPTGQVSSGEGPSAGGGLTQALASSGIAPAAAGAPQQPGWPMSNPCCSGAIVPAGLRHMPSSVPQYPNGRLFVSGSIPEMGMGDGAKMEFYYTGDSTEAVADFYRAQMPQYGWQPDTVPLGAMPEAGAGMAGMGSAKSEALAFRVGKASCLVSVVQVQGMPEGSEILKQLPADFQAKMSPEELEAVQQNQTTVIVVAYLEEPPPPDPSQYGAMHGQPPQP